MTGHKGLTPGRSTDSEANAMSIAEQRTLRDAAGEAGLAPMHMTPGYGDTAR